MMHLSLIKLGRRAGKDGIDFALVEALAVAMEEGDVADAGPAILDNSIWRIFRHGIILISTNKDTNYYNISNVCYLFLIDASNNYYICVRNLIIY